MANKQQDCIKKLSDLNTDSNIIIQMRENPNFFNQCVAQQEDDDKKDSTFTDGGRRVSIYTRRRNTRKRKAGKPRFI
jgi:hypothetical protein